MKEKINKFTVTACVLVLIGIIILVNPSNKEIFKIDIGFGDYGEEKVVELEKGKIKDNNILSEHMMLKPNLFFFQQIK